MIVPNIRKIITGAKAHPRLQSAFTEIEKYLRHLTGAEERIVKKMVDFENTMHEQEEKKMSDVEKRISDLEDKLKEWTNS